VQRDVQLRVLEMQETFFATAAWRVPHVVSVVPVLAKIVLIFLIWKLVRRVEERFVMRIEKLAMCVLGLNAIIVPFSLIVIPAVSGSVVYANVVLVTTVGMCSVSNVFAKRAVMAAAGSLPATCVQATRLRNVKDAKTGFVRIASKVANVALLFVIPVLILTIASIVGKRLCVLSVG
jgi:hypothetical protein